MSLTILNTPTSPNVTGTNLIYTISSSVVPAYQYRYLVDVYESGSATRLARFKYPQNSSGTVNIDLGRVLDDYLDYDYNWKTIGEQNTSHSKNFDIKFGDEYGTSYTSNVTTYPDQVSSSISVFKGNIQYPSLKSSTEFQSSSINFNFFPYKNATYVYDAVLSNNSYLNASRATSKYSIPDNKSTGYKVAQPLGHNDYATETYIKNSNTNAYNIIHIFDDNNNLIWYSIPNLQSLDPVVRNIVDTLSYPRSSSFSVGTGIQNLSASLVTSAYTGSLGTAPLSASISSSNQWNYIVNRTFNFGGLGSYHYYYNEDKGPDVLLNTDTGSRYSLDAMSPDDWAPIHYPTYCNNEKTRFAFINSFGAWDYYNVYMPTRRVTNIDRKIYEQPRLNLNEYQTTYNVSNRGETQYYTEYTDDFEITTDIIDSQESQWLRELFESTEVYIQSGSDFIPINILNTTEQIINNSARNKQFQYTIRYQFSNLREPR